MSRINSVPHPRGACPTLEQPENQPPQLTQPSAVPLEIPQRNWLWRFFHLPFSLFFRVWVRVSTEGLENLDDSRGGLLLINHQSYLDPLLVAVRFDRPVAYLARDSLFRIPIIGWILRRTYVIAISRESVRTGSIREAIQRLEEGHLVGIFPEGTRSSGTEVKTFRPGFLAIVRRTSQPIYPVAVAGADRLMPRGSFFVRPGRVQIVYGPPMSAEELLNPEHGADDRELSEFARSKVAALHQRAQQLLGKQ